MKAYTSSASIKMTMLKNMAKLIKLRKRKKEFAERFQTLKTKNTFVKFSLSKIKAMGLVDTSTKMDFTTLGISRTAHSMVLEQNITQMDQLKIKVSGKTVNFLIIEYITINFIIKIYSYHHI
jgi:hypothetical protein